jgi:F420-non-reducing hydrogenase large subunit
MARSMVAFAQKALALFEIDLLGDPAIAEVIGSDTYYHETYYAGMVDDQKRVNFYDGKIRVKGPDGTEKALFEPKDYLDHIAERVEPWSYMKLPYLKQVGWIGMADGPESGVFRVNALARLNVAEGMATPRAQEGYERFCEHFNTPVVHHTLAYHWARLIECLFASEEVLRLAQDPEITAPMVHQAPTATPKEGVGVVEAPRGTLYHHYTTDSKGMVESVNLIVATAQNNAGMNLSVKKAAEKLIRGGQVSDELLDRVEMAFRAYDPCLACATHALPGRMPLKVALHQGGRKVMQLCRDRS